MLTQSILDYWDTLAKGYSAEIKELSEIGYPAWVIKTKDLLGVAIPNSQGKEVSEKFSNAQLFNDELVFKDSHKEDALFLLTEHEKVKQPFATLCAEFVNPGNSGNLRKEICINPVMWWAQWKELLGNKNVDDRVYDALGELCVLRFLAQKGVHAVWNGPTASTYDIDCEDIFYEVKSTTARKHRKVTLSNQFQLDPPDGKGLMLVLCQFEPSVSGTSINSLVEDLVNLGYSRYDLDSKLELLGLEKRKSSRNRCYILHAMTRYVVDANFPAIRESSFIGGIMPRCIETITYTISLDGVDGERLIEVPESL